MARPLCRIVHLSDIHVGRLACAGIEKTLLRSVNAAGADLVAVTGDLVQRAHRWQYRHVAAWLASVEAPLLIIPGNHDLYSWMYRPWMRVAAPLGRFKRMIGRDLCPSWEGPGVSVLGLNTSTPWTIQRGRCTPQHARSISAHFDAKSKGTFKVLAVHHPLADVGMPFQRDVALGAELVLSAAARVGVDLILCGHWHLSLVHTVEIEGRRMVVALAGTAASGRYRDPQAGLNAFNVVDLYPGNMVLEEWRYSRSESSYEAGRRQRFTRVTVP